MCEGIESTPETARLQKVLSKDHANGLGTLKKTDGSFTGNSQETLNLMMETHFQDLFLFLLLKAVEMSVFVD